MRENRGEQKIEEKWARMRSELRETRGKVNRWQLLYGLLWKRREYYIICKFWNHEVSGIYESKFEEGKLEVS
jgi:hypothetical protein